LREECRLRVFENRVLRRIFGLNEVEVEVTGEWRRLHNKKFYATSSNIIRVIKSRRLRWVVNVALMGGGERAREDLHTGF
jgi:hypothetical protein